jgi:glycosyltransferase involved in cell wall biosynthesis
MRIGIDAYPLTREKFTGLGTYLLNLVKELEVIDKENEYFLYGCKDFSLPFKNDRWHTRLITGPKIISQISTLWLVWGCRGMLRRDKIDVFIGTQNLVPIFLPASIKKILVMHDLCLYICPQNLALSLYLAHKMIFPKSIFSADRIIAITDSTRTDIKRFFPRVDNAKIDTVYYGGPAEDFKPVDKGLAREYVAEKFNQSGRFILTVASLEWRKNITGLLKAFRLCKEKHKIDFNLLIVGGEKRSKVGEIYSVYNNLSLKDSVFFLGHADTRDLLHLYNAAEVLVFPSFYEGFGLPPLEAMACGTCVVASDIPVFREILQDAALLVDANDPQKISEGIYEVLTNRSAAQELKTKGLERVKTFSWRKTAEQTLGVISKLKQA